MKNFLYILTLSILLTGSFIFASENGESADEPEMSGEADCFYLSSMYEAEKMRLICDPKEFPHLVAPAFNPLAVGSPIVDEETLKNQHNPIGD